MKKVLLVLSALTLGVGFSSAKEKFGYKVEVNFDQPIKDKKVYLAHYFGKGLPTIYKLDSTDVINGSKAVFQKTDSILGGIHLVMYDANTKFFHLLLDNDYQVKVSVDTAGKAHFTENAVNKDFEAHEHKMIGFQEEKNKLREQLKGAKKKSDSTKIDDQFKAIVQKEKDYRRQYVAKNNKSLLTQIYNAMDAPDLPKNKVYLEDGKTVDSIYPLRYYKAHFWDKFDFTDNRLIKTALLDGRLGEYFNSLVYPIPDTINYEIDQLLKRAEPAKEIYKYILHWAGNWTHENKMMGVDASFVYLVENYYGKGKAFWLDSAAIARYQDRAGKIAPNVLGNKAPSLILQDLNTLFDIDITKATEGPYTVLAFWSSDCGHCMEEMPKVANLYNKELKKEGIKFISIPTKVEGGNDIKKIYQDWGVTDWVTLVDAHNKKEHQAIYDVSATPVIYVLDKDKKIIGKKLTSSAIKQVIDFDKERLKKLESRK